MHSLIQQPPRSRDRYVIRSGFLQSIAQKSAQAKTVGHSPADTTLAADPFKESDQQQSEIHARSQRRPPQFPVIEHTALFLAKRIKPRLVQHRIESLVERMARRFRPLAGIEQLFLFLSGSLRPHCHA